MSRATLTDAQWERLQPLLPPQKPRTGRPAKNHRLVLDGIPWIARTGAPWQVVASRFYRWHATGVWDALLAALQRRADAKGRLDWGVHYVDGTTIRAHQHAARARGGDPEAEALGRSRGGFSTEVYLRAKGNGKPLTLLLTPGQRHEASAFEQLMMQGAVTRGTRASEAVPQAGGRRQGLQQRGAPPTCPAARHRRDDPAQAQRAAARAVRVRGTPFVARMAAWAYTARTASPHTSLLQPTLP